MSACQYFQKVKNLKVGMCRVWENFGQGVACPSSGKKKELCRVRIAWINEQTAMARDVAMEKSRLQRQLAKERGKGLF